MTKKTLRALKGLLASIKSPVYLQYVTEYNGRRLVIHGQNEYKGEMNYKFHNSIPFFSCLNKTANKDGNYRLTTDLKRAITNEIKTYIKEAQL